MPSARHKVVVVGLGKRGTHHADAFRANPRFELAGVCDVDSARLQAATAKYGVTGSTDAHQLASELRPDVFCFCTLPNLDRKSVV